MIKKNLYPGILVILLIFTACSAPQLSSSNPQASPTPEPTHQKTLTICLGEEPNSLYFFTANSTAARNVLQAIYDGPVDYVDGDTVPVIFEKLPNLSDRSAYFTPVEVNPGEAVINTTGDLVSLQAGVQVFPSDCTSPSCTITWDGINPIWMDQLTATYKLKSGLTWSDGHPLKTSDSVYSFKIASDPATPTNKHAIEQTASYTATDDLTIQWVSKPGLVTDAFEKYFWNPSPEHAWGKYTASELLTADEVNRRPLGWGAYQVDEWVDGQSIHFVKNPYYFRVDEGLPYFDTLVFKFINPHGDTALSNLKFDRAPFQQFNYDLGDFDKEISENGCDLTTTTSDIREQLPVLNILLYYFQDSAIKVIKSASEENELLLFNMREDAPGSSNPLTWLEVRKAISLCLNREKAIKDLSFGLYNLPDATLFTNMVNGTQEMASYSFDPVVGSALLDQAGWKVHDNQSNFPRVSSGIPNTTESKELSFTYLVEDIEDNLKAAEIFKASLAECGIGINSKAIPTEIYWDASHKDSIFQGHFDLVQLSWAATKTDPCLLFSSQFIPLVDNNYLGSNFSGYRNEEFDNACDQLETMHLKTDRDALLKKMEFFINEDLPMIPLYSYSKLMIAQKDFCEDSLDVTSNNDLAGIEEFVLSPDCS
ncbi:MAG: ABC transporter substrate-binding protein [Pelolinea sp.]|nr:ABC transporter substrate-binding protein [Pelolinea sp.]